MIFQRKQEVDTDSKKISELLTRGVENIYPSKEFLKSKLEKGEPLSLYLGIDPTGPSLHMGHAIALMKLKHFQELGHRVILLVGDFTGMIGDPTDKSATRKQLTRAEVSENSKLYKKQAATFLSFKGTNKAELAYNSTWLSKLTFAEVIDLMSKMTVNQMLERDMFKRRMEEGKPIHMHEFVYPLMQGYDSVAMNVDGEIGGNDQTFNMLTGRNLMKEMAGKEKFVLTMKLLTDNQGKKMGKTEGNAIVMTDSPNEMFGKVMSWTDQMILPGFELCTLVPSEEISNIARELESGTNPRDLKLKLAREIVSVYYGQDAASKAESSFLETFNNGGVPDDVAEVAAGEKLLVDILLEHKIISSKTEWRRLIDEGAITVIESGAKISDPFEKAKPATLKIGKRRFIKIV